MRDCELWEGSVCAAKNEFQSAHSDEAPLPLTLRPVAGLPAVNGAVVEVEGPVTPAGRSFKRSACGSIGEKLATISASAHSSRSSSLLRCGGCEDEPARVRVGEAKEIEEEAAWLSSDSESAGSKLEGNVEEASTKDLKPSDSVLAWPKDSETEPLPRRRSEDSGEDIFGRIKGDASLGSSQNHA